MVSESVICDTEFETPDSNNPTYSLTEVDFNVKNRMISVRKNLETQEFEIYEYGKPETPIANSPDLKEVIKALNKILKTESKFHNEKAVICNHTTKRVSGCMG